MFTQDAIQELGRPQAIAAALAAILQHADHGLGIVALPEEFKVTDLEPYMPARRRQRGQMDTQSLGDFATYVDNQADEGASVFVNAAAMKATAVLNLGIPGQPGHCDHIASYSPPATAAYRALREIASGQHPQARIAEFLEDWLDHISAERDGQAIDAKKAIASIRRITIEALRKQETTSEQLRAEQSTFESITASSRDLTLPSFINFRCVPYLEMQERTFRMRLGLITSDKPALTLRVASFELHIEQMGEELCQRVRDAVADLPVIAGSFSPR
ncbi:MAG: YfdQ family protein [Rubrivivax sp.]|jgi:uncharacterized protein YfdQ (DUF2303 family)|nr:YfdQ family protein [Rubrivivax sp.]